MEYLNEIFISKAKGVCMGVDATISVGIWTWHATPIFCADKDCYMHMQ